MNTHGDNETPPKAPVEELFTQRRVCEIFSISKKTLKNWRKAGRISVVYPMGKPPEGFSGQYMVRITRSEVERVMAEMGVKHVI